MIGSLAALSTLALTFASPAAQTAGTDWLSADLDGRLDSDAFLPVSSDAAESLSLGDRALSEARASDDPATRELRRLACFESWRAALLAPPGQWVAFRFVPPQLDDLPTEDPTGWSARLFEGVEEAVLRRVALLTSPEREQRRERLGPLARADLNAAWGDPGELAGVERAHPGLRGALEAALQLGDRALESGRVAAAEAWYSRAERHATLGAAAPDSPALEAIERRLEAARGALRPTSRAPRWDDAQSLELEAALPLIPGPLQERRGSSPKAGRARISSAIGGGLRSGLAVLDKERVAVLGPRDLTFVDLDERGALRTVEWPKWISDALPELEFTQRAWARREAPGWSLEPIAVGSDVALVLGRHDNLLVVVGSPELGRTRLDRPHLRWAARGTTTYRSTPEGLRTLQFGETKPGATAGDTPAGDEPPMEFQPGGVRVGQSLIVEARTYAEGVRSHLIAFDVRSGAVLWTRFLAKGNDLVTEVAAGRGSALPAAAQKLVSVGSRVFAGTHLGVGCLVDTIDGRPIWAQFARRRSPDQRGWTGGRPLLLAALRGAESDSPDRVVLEPQLLWGPADSDFLYHLRLGRDALHLGPWVRPPQERVGIDALLGADRDSRLFLARAGARRTLRSVDLETGRSTDALHYGAGDRASAAAAVGTNRVLHISGPGLYLFDRGRELYLLDREPLPERPLPGITADLERAALYTVGERVLVLAGDVLFVYRALR